MNQKLYLVASSRRKGSTGFNSGPPAERRAGCQGRIVELFIGAGHGSIRMENGRAIYFHRGDLLDSTPFNAFKVGDPVVFELLEDRFSGARALHVEPRGSR
jgi:hypothetical protein